ncbi:MAG: hypothetical protein ACKO0X_05690 [Bacteroidota bacterium]
MNLVFDICVNIMIWMSHLLGITYKQLNVILFVILHPIITVVLYFLYRKYKRLYQSTQTKKQ